MKTSPLRKSRRGYASVLLVLSTGSILSILMLNAYRRASDSQSAQSQVQLRVDYSEKEEAILRSIVAITPNRAIRAMRTGSDVDTVSRAPMTWSSIFTESLVLANARTSITPTLVAAINVPNLRVSNTGDSALADPARIFAAMPPEAGLVSTGLNRSLGAGFPVPLTSSDNNTNARDLLYPLISNSKIHGALTQGGVALPVAQNSNYNLWQYPQINFGYARPGENFVAKRNWWAFSVDVADHDDNLTNLARAKRNFVLSIYEIPSQLSISSSSFMSLGQYASGSAWQNVNIDGGMFVGQAAVTGETALNALASRRGMTLSNESTVGGQNFGANPFTPGTRETFQNQRDTAAPVSLINQTTLGAFFPVSLASESGRASFIPISRGAEFFDRFHASNAAETNTISNTTWNNYTVGAMQCAMRLDITRRQSATNATPTELRFSYLRTDGTRGEEFIQLTSAATVSIPSGYVKIRDENQSHTFAGPVDIAYGAPGGFTFRHGISGTVTFNNATFGDPLVGTFKGGYWRPRASHQARQLPSGQLAIALYPERLPAFLAVIGGAPVGPATPTGPFGPGVVGAPFYNNSIAVNVDYSNLGPTYPTQPNIPCTNNDYGLIIEESANLTPYTRGFSIVTNLRTYIGDDFNDVAATPPAGFSPAVTTSNPTGRYLPPCSLFTPEKRFGVSASPFSLDLRGQIGSLAQADRVTTAEAALPMVRPLESKNRDGVAYDANRITVNLSQIRHPAEMPPIVMMNWLVLLEERRREFQ